MTIDDKVRAVEDFIDWREETGSVDPLSASLDRWRAVLQAADDASLLARIRSEAKFVRGKPEEAAALLEEVLGG